VSRPGDWHLVGRFADPTPGEAWGVREIAGVYGRTVSAVGQMRSLVTAVRSASGTGIWHGASGDAFRELLEDFPAQIEACETSYATARDAMNWWAGRIEDHQASADRGLEQARAADQDLRAAQVALDTALSNASRTSSALERIERDAIRYRNTLPPAGVTVPTASQIAAARRASSQAATAQASAARAASDAQSRLDVASRLVAEAAASYEADAATTISRVERASEQALPENSLWEKIYRSDAWHVIVTIATVVVIIAAVAAFVLTGPIAAIVGAIALVAGVLLALNDVMAWKAGDKAGWEALLSVALTIIPGGLLLKAGRATTSLALRAGMRLAPRATTAATTTLRTTARLGSDALLRITRLTDPWVNRINHAITNAASGLPSRPAFTGGAVRPRPPRVDEWDSWADEVYQGLRADEGLAARIADHVTDLTEDEVRLALDNVLVHEHRLGGGMYGPEFTARFDADPDMAEAFIRMSRGEPTEVDLMLLRHELAEAQYWIEHPGAHYSEAHAHANEVSNWANVSQRES
jgi:hypothetical protein